MNKLLNISLKLKALAAATILSLLLTAISIFYWIRIENNQHTELQKILQSESNKVTELLANQFTTFDLVARSVKGFIEGSEDVTDDEFRTFISSLDLINMAPGIQGVGLSWLYVNLDFDEELARITTRNFQNNQSDAWSKNYAPIIYMEPQYFNGIMVGHNILSNISNKNAAQLSSNLNILAASDRITIQYDAKINSKHYYNLFFPIYSSLEKSQKTIVTEKNLLGWVLINFSLEELLQPITQTLQDELQIRYIENTENDEEEILIAYMNGFQIDDQKLLTDKTQSIKKITNFAARNWSFEINASNQFINKYLKNSHTWIAISGILLGASLGFITYLIMTALSVSLMSSATLRILPVISKAKRSAR